MPNHSMAPAYPHSIFIKVSRSKVSPLLLQNHWLWTESLLRHMPEQADFAIAPVYESGRLGKYQWLMGAYIDGTPFSVEHEGLSTIMPEQPARYFPAIVRLMRFIQTTPVQSLHGVDYRLGKPARFDKLQLWMK